MHMWIFVEIKKKNSLNTFGENAGRNAIGIIFFKNISIKSFRSEQFVETLEFKFNFVERISYLN